MTYRTGTLVEYIRHEEDVTIQHGSIGKVTGRHDVLGWPTVYFPYGTFGPYAEFSISPAHLVPAHDVPARTCAALGVDYRPVGDAPCVNCTSDLTDHDAEDLRLCQREHDANLGL